jgi:hypothetical protein
MIEIEITSAESTNGWFPICGHGCDTVAEAERYMQMKPSALRYRVNGGDWVGPEAAPPAPPAPKPEPLDHVVKINQTALKEVIRILKEFEQR